jgi:hypothetical protein
MQHLPALCVGARNGAAPLGSNSAGDWAIGEFWGPLANETRAWLDHLSTGAPTVHTTPEQARINLETTIAIERAVESGHAVRLPLQAEDSH